MPRLLVVDDDSLARLLLGQLLGAEGWDVVSVATLAEARALLARGAAYDVVVLDGELPDGTGQQLAAQLPALLPAAHVVLHSGHVATGRPPGVSAVVPKGDGVDALLEHVAAHAPG